MQKSVMLCSILFMLQSYSLDASERDGCIKAASRISACPHQLFRAMQLPDMEQSAVRCICVTDFLPLLAEPENAEQRLAQLRLRQQFQAQLQHDVEPILQILRRER